jgi:hypothetical protein
VLFLDADELVDQSFCGALNEAVRRGRYDGFWLNYTTHFLGRKLRHGIPQRKLALFKVGSGLYERIDENAWTKLDMEVHEHPIIDGPVGHIAQEIDHRDHAGIAKFIDRHRDYTVWEAQRLLLLERGERLGASTLTERQRFKYANIARWWYPWLYFLYAYVWKRGFLDGTPGLYYAFYKSWYFLSIRLMIAEARAARREDS